MKLLGRLKLWQKLGLLVVALSIPAVIVGFLYIKESNTKVATIEAELEGARYLQGLADILNGVLNHRGRASAFLSGDSGRKGAIEEAQLEIEEHITHVDENDALLGEKLDTTARWSEIKGEWARLKGRMGSMLVDECNKAHDELVARIVAFRDHVAMSSGLAMDGDQATFSMIEVATKLVPDALDDTAVARTRATMAAFSGEMSDTNRAIMQWSQLSASRRIERLETQLAWAQELPKAATEVAPAIQKVREEFTRYNQYIEGKLLRDVQIGEPGSAVYDAGGATRDALIALSDKAYGVMNESLQARAAAEAGARNLVVFMTLALMGVAFALAWIITLAMTKPMSQAVSLFGAIAGGKYDNEVKVSGTDEAGQVLSALGDMQGKLRAQIETERLAAMENARIRQALDKVSTNVVLADDAQQIIYVNEAAEQTFARNESELRRALPALHANALRGSNVEVLCKDETRKRRLRELQGTDTEESRYGDCTFKVVVNAVVNERGERLGTVMEWTNRTQEIAVEQEVSSLVSQAVDGDLSVRVKLADKTGFFQKLGQDMNSLLENMSGIVARIRDSAVDVQTGAEEISQGNANLSQRTEEQASSLEETASSIEEMTSTVKQNADNAGQANQLAVAARDQADKGGAVVAKAVKAMSEINDSSKKIADIIGVIDEIAFQTNLLALNAAVEAARAGEQGRGFAVVASEVRNLAQRSATAAKEIKDLIQDSVKRVDEGSSLVTQSGQTLEQIVAAVKKVSDIVAEIAAASHEQSTGIEQVNKAVMQLDELTQQNAALVEEAAAASESMADQARALGTAIGKYKVADDRKLAASLAPPAATGAIPAAGTKPVAGTKPASGTKQATSVKPPARQSAAVERRKATRPWSNAAPKHAAVEAPVRAAKAASTGSDDSEWSEF